MSCVKLVNMPPKDTNIGVGMKEMNVVEAQSAL
jgi:hypothetical protein